MHHYLDRYFLLKEIDLFETQLEAFRKYLEYHSKEIPEGATRLYLNFRRFCEAMLKIYGLEIDVSNMKKEIEEGRTAEKTWLLEICHSL